MLDEVTGGGGVDCGEDGSDLLLENDGFLFVAESFLLILGDGFPVDDVLKEDAADGRDHSVDGVGHLTDFVVDLVGELLAEVAACDAVEDFSGFFHGADDSRGDRAREEDDCHDDDDEQSGEDDVRLLYDGARVGFTCGRELIRFVDELEDGFEVALVKGAEFVVENALRFWFVA